jgi:NAD(P)-dependent dehydrogenase (short-subunit alcohol dehydrogenase family)
LGPPEVLVYNAAARRFKSNGILEVSTEEFVNFWKINCLGAFFASREVVPSMLEKGSGTIILTGKMDNFITQYKKEPPRHCADLPE